MRILLTGAAGFIGRHLQPRLAETGAVVVRLRRGGSEGGAPGEWRVPLDLRETATAAGWPGPIDAVIHLAAANPARGEEGAGDIAHLRRVNVEGTAALAERCRREGVGRFVFLSTANVHAPRSDRGPITPADPVVPQSPYAQSKAEAEEALRAVLGGTGTTWTVLRPAPVFGRGGRGTVALLARLARTPLPLPLEGLGGRRSLVAVEDLVEAILLAARVPAAANETLLLAGGAATPAEIVHSVREGSGRPARLLPAPASVLGALARGLGKRQAFETLAGDFVLDTAHGERVLGWQPGAALSTRLAAMGKQAAVRRN